MAQQPNQPELKQNNRNTVVQEAKKCVILIERCQNDKEVLEKRKIQEENRLRRLKLLEQMLLTQFESISRLRTLNLLQNVCYIYIYISLIPHIRINIYIYF